MVDLHAEWLERATRRVVAAPSGRHQPVVKLLAIYRDGHALGGLVDFNEQFGVSSLAKRKRREGGRGQWCDELAMRIGEHSRLVPDLITLNRKSIELVLLVVDGLREGVILWLRFGLRLFG